MDPAMPDPGQLARAVRECCKTFDQKGVKYDATRFRKQVEQEAGLAENHLMAYQTIVERIRKQQNEAIHIADPLQKVYSGRRESDTKDMDIVQSFADKDMKSRKMAKKKGENHSDFYKTRRASTDNPVKNGKSAVKPRVDKNKRSRYSQLLGKDTTESLQQRQNRQAEAKSKRGRETKESRRARQASTKTRAKPGKTRPMTPTLDSKPRAFGGLCCLFLKSRAKPVILSVEPDASEEEDSGAEDTGTSDGKSDAELIHHLSNTAPSQW